MSHATYLKPMELWAFLENSDFQRRRNGNVIRHDEVKLIRHDEFLDVDYGLMQQIGCVGIRDAARWYLSHPAPHTFDWSWMDRVVESAARYNLKLYLDLWHYGYPDWMNILSADAPLHLAEFAQQIALRYPTLQHYCVSNEPSLMVEFAGRIGRWRPFLRKRYPIEFRRQICRMIIVASKAILEVNPTALLILPEPWFSSGNQLMSEDYQAAVIDTVLGFCDPELGGSDELITVIGLNHYRDTTIPPFHQLLLNARKRWPNKPLWLTETSGPPHGWRQTEWFWWMLAETRLANLEGADVEVFTWAPAISMYDWVHEHRHLRNGIWTIDADGQRIPNGRMIDAIELARSYDYLT